MSSPEEHCIACNRMNYKSHFRLEFRGLPYDPNTYEPLPTVKQKRRARAEKRKAAKAKAKKRARQNHSQTPSSQESDSSDEGTTSEEEDKIRAKDDIFLGPHCKKRSILYHSMAHWGMPLRICSRDTRLTSRMDPMEPNPELLSRSPPSQICGFLGRFRRLAK